MGTNKQAPAANKKQSGRGMGLRDADNCRKFLLQVYFLSCKDVSSAENFSSLLAKGTVKISLGTLHSEGTVIVLNFSTCFFLKAFLNTKHVTLKKEKEV
jgi:hypothetical protein